MYIEKRDKDANRFLKKVEAVKELVAKYPFQLSTVCSELLSEGIEVSKRTVKRFLKKLGYSYERARKRIKKRDQVLFEKAEQEIILLKKEVSKHKHQNLYFFDESSFSFTPNIPYGWSPTKETIEIESNRSNALKVLKFLGLDNQLKAYTTKTTIDATLLIQIFNDFVQNLAKGEKATVILDNAPTHTHNAFQAQILLWQKQGLTLYFLPPYSPELNRIEILWRFMKYHWIDYTSTTTLENYIFRVLQNYAIGQLYEINFG